MKAQTLKLATGAIAIATVVASFVFVAGISDQLRFTMDHRCLLFVENYHKVIADGNYMYLFDSLSQACNGAVAVGAIGLFCIIAFCGLQIYFNKVQQPMPRKVLKYTISII